MRNLVLCIKSTNRTCESGTEEGKRNVTDFKLSRETMKDTSGGSSEKDILL